MRNGAVPLRGDKGSCLKLNNIMTLGIRMCCPGEESRFRHGVSGMNLSTKRVILSIVLPLLVMHLIGCAGVRSATFQGGNLFAQWVPTEEMLEADPELQRVRWYHAESMQLGSYISGLWAQTGEELPMNEPNLSTKRVILSIVLPLLVMHLIGCAGVRSATFQGGNLFAQWVPTEEMLEADPELQRVRWYHAESMQLGSYISGLWAQTGEELPMLVDGSLTTQAGPINAALGAGGLIGAALLFNPDSDNTNVSQEGGRAESNSESSSESNSYSLAGSKSDSSSSAAAYQKQGQYQGQKQGQIQGQKQGQFQVNKNRGKRDDD